MPFKGVSFIVLMVIVLAACQPAAVQTAAPIATELPLSPTSLPPSPTSPPPSETPSPTETPTPPTPTPQGIGSLFHLVSLNPIVPPGPEQPGDTQYADPGAATFYEGKFHMFYNAFNGWPSEVTIRYATSQDGAEWQRENLELSISPDDLAYVKFTALASSLLVEEDGTWVMYFYTWDTLSTSAPGVIGRATAPSPSGPWTPDAGAVLETGPEGAWDEHSVRAPSVVKTENGYVMFYTGMNRSQRQAIGMATSQDGVHWTKYDDPATTEATDASLAESDPVFVQTEGDAWDSTQVHQPKVVWNSEEYAMIYRSRDPLTRVTGYGLATSPDGISWTRSQSNPVLSTEMSEAIAGMWFHELVYHQDTYYLFVEIGRGGNNTRIFLSKHQGELHQ
jgi:hypothetical protein